MNKIEITKRHLIIIGFISVFAVIFTVVWMAFTGNTPQVYDDIIIGTISRNIEVSYLRAGIRCYRISTRFIQAACFKAFADA